MKRLLLSMFAMAGAALAADVTGEWKASAEGPNGPMQRTFTLKAEGNKLTGETTSSVMGKSTITDGKIDGANLSFVIVVRFQENEMKLDYKGKVVSDDEIKFTVETQNGAIEWQARRVK